MTMSSMRDQEVFFSHPHDHFNLRHITAVPNTCFVLMPFDHRFDIVYDTIVDALRGLIVCTWADDIAIGNPILERILTGIRSAEFIIADLTGRNPNVFYELGLAHTQTKNVLLLTQDINDVPFDLRHLFCHTYSPHSKRALQDLKRIVRRAALEVRAKSVPAMLQGVLDRTKQIVDYMQRILASPKGVRGLVIRIQAGFSSLSNIGYADSDDKQQREYGEWLEREQDNLIEMIEKGATVQAIIFPPVGPWTDTSGERWLKRFDKLLKFLGKFLDSRSDLRSRCEFVVSTEEGPNLFFFGEDILFEGHKTGIEGGYGFTMVYTDADYIATRLKIFDMLFQSARRHTLKRYGPDGSADSGGETLRQAVITAVKRARDGTSLPRWPRTA